MKKNFSIAKLYSDLEKYQANLTGLKDSRLKRQGSGTSLHQRPQSIQKNHQSRQSLGYGIGFGATTTFGGASIGNITRFEKQRTNKLEVSQKLRYPRPTFDKYSTGDKKQIKPSLGQRSYLNSAHYTSFDGIGNSHHTSVLKQPQHEPTHIKQSRYTKSQELYFLSECSKLYNLQSPGAVENSRSQMNAKQEEDCVKRLLTQINKRDKVYELVTTKLGAENVEQKLQLFFKNYDRITKIVNEFKRMSKLNIDDDEQLYQFLVNDDEEADGKENISSQKQIQGLKPANKGEGDEKQGKDGKRDNLTHLEHLNIVVQEL